MPPGMTDEKRVRTRNMVLMALLALLMIYTIKFSFPQHPVHIVASQSPTTATGALPDDEEKPTKPDVKLSPTAIPHHNEPFNGTIVDKVAVIIEDRPRTNLIPLILHFSAVLGPSWPVIIYTPSENVGLFSSSKALKRHLATGIIQIRILPETVLFTNSDSVSSFLTKPWLWKNLAPAKWILMFQSDSMLCANAARSVEDFFEYDFVGAPIRQDQGTGMNGGLSLRKRDTILRILDENDWEEEKGPRFEDRWYFDRLLELIDAEDEAGVTNGVKLPSIEVARTFAVETIDFPHPLGVHQVGRWINTNVKALDTWCPEYKLCSTEYVKDTPTGQ